MKKLLQDWISAQAERRPEAVAVVMGGDVLTYGQLEESANRFARLLKAALKLSRESFIDAAAKTFKGMTADINNTQHTSLVDSDDTQSGIIKLLRDDGVLPPGLRFGFIAALGLAEILGMRCRTARCGCG